MRRRHGCVSRAHRAPQSARERDRLGDDPAIFTRSLARDVAGTRIGWLGDLDGHLPMERGVLDVCTRALARFESIGCIVDALRLAFDPERLWDTWRAWRGLSVAGSLGASYADPTTRDRMKPEAIWEVEQGLALTAADVYRASKERTAWYRAVTALFDTVDYLVLPTAQVFPFDADLDWPKSIAGRSMDTYHRWMEVVIGPTLAGLPVLAVPAGFNDAGLPMGLQVIGPPRADFALLQLGRAYERAMGPRARPALSSAR